jgi:hypothetical protein
MKQGAIPPYIKIQRKDGTPRLCLQGTLGKSEIEIKCCSYAEPAAAALAKAVSDFLESYSGAAGASDTIDFSIWDNPGESAPIPEQDGGDKYRYTVPLIFTVWHQ